MSEAPFQLATCGWVLGPQHDRAALDNDLPKNIPMSAISRETAAWRLTRHSGGYPAARDGRSPGLKAITGKAWPASSFLPGGCAVTRRRAGLRLHGPDGLQWRTTFSAPNVAALAEAAWNQSGWNSTLGKTRAMPVPSTEGALGGMIADFSGQKIKGTANATLYQTCRYGLEGYNMKIPNGR